ncbi:MAG: hypothetical protein AB8G22_16655 [Saprospiraceae bacterium]
MNNLFSVLFLFVALCFTACSPEELPIPADLATTNVATQQLTVASSESHTASLDGEFSTIELRVISADYSRETAELSIEFSGELDFTDAECSDVQELQFISPTGKTISREFMLLESNGSEGYLQMLLSPAQLNKGDDSKGEEEIDSTQSIVITEDIVII